ncbi:MAG: S8 family serine peptidase [Flavobacteriales bacterium]|nr:S8 family serine peptidase [Flavobacteriales bacterium]
MFFRALLAMFMFVCVLHAQESHRYLVRLSPGVEKSDLLQKGVNTTFAYKSSIEHASFFNEFLYLEVSDTAVLVEMMASGDLLYWESPRKRTLQFEPSDSHSAKQWHLDKIQAASAWDIAKGDSSFVLGIVDSGVDYTHEDLRDNLAYNHDDPLNGLDDDGDGYIDNYYGWDFGSDDWNPMIEEASEHGSVIAGVASAATDNELGSASPAFHCRYLPVKVTDSSGQIRHTNEAILYAAEMGAQVINCSFGSPEYRQSEADVIQYVTNVMDVLVVASAGNGGADALFYPAALDLVLGVGATDEYDQKIAISNYGSSVNIMAPGMAIYGPNTGNQYRYSNGTSVSSAIVSSSAVLLRSHYPNETAFQIRRRLQDSADDIDAYNLQYKGLLGAGRLNLVKALLYTSPVPEEPLSITLRPNPNSGVFKLDLYLQELGNYQLSVFDVYGKLYYREDFGADTNFIEKSLTLEHLNQGCYIVQVSNSKVKSSSLFVVFD